MKWNVNHKQCVVFLQLNVHETKGSDCIELFTARWKSYGKVTIYYAKEHEVEPCMIC